MSSKVTGTWSESVENIRNGDRGIGRSTIIIVVQIWTPSLLQTCHIINLFKCCIRKYIKIGMLYFCFYTWNIYYSSLLKIVDPLVCRVSRHPSPIQWHPKYLRWCSGVVVGPTTHWGPPHHWTSICSVPHMWRRDRPHPRSIWPTAPLVHHQRSTGTHTMHRAGGGIQLTLWKKH